MKPLAIYQSSLGPLAPLAVRRLSCHHVARAVCLAVSHQRAAWLDCRTSLRCCYNLRLVFWSVVIRRSHRCYCKQRQRDDPEPKRWCAVRRPPTPCNTATCVHTLRTATVSVGRSLRLGPTVLLPGALTEKPASQSMPGLQQPIDDLPVSRDNVAAATNEESRASVARVPAVALDDLHEPCAQENRRTGITCSAARHYDWPNNDGDCHTSNTR